MTSLYNYVQALFSHLHCFFCNIYRIKVQLTLFLSRYSSGQNRCAMLLTA